MNYSNTQIKILKAAESFIQKRGYNAFSYKDIAAAVGIKTSSIHYYYPAKEDLALAVIQWQLENLCLVLDDIKRQPLYSAKQKIMALVDAITALTFHDEMKMCLGGMFASDVLSLPESVQSQVRFFFKVLREWIAQILTDDMNVVIPIDNMPSYLLLQIEGALLMSRLYDDVSHIELVKQFINHVMK